MSYNEVGFICAGRNDCIVSVFRIKNASQTTRHRYVWDRKQRSEVLTAISKKELVVLAEGHSHPHPRHLRRPSREDIDYFKHGIPHIIVFPCESEIRGWILGNKMFKAKNAQIQIVVI
ncbi:Mov34/MPN/PAD-1 family protein [Bdellovibrio bacteriovorus]|uniref:Mov34/MPN/PAD-1 family protein n=1 Tax=Bdellovibrio bacteriovorus TaxID=959 RepID=UPI00059FBA47